MEIKKGCAFTGHRTIPRAEEALLARALDAAIATFYGIGCRSFFAGGALGFDTLAAERTILFRARHPDARLFLLLPCRDQCRDWSDGDIRRYRAILDASDGYRYIRDAYDKDAMRDRNAALIEASDGLIAYVTRAASGAGQTLRMATCAGHTVINLGEDRFRRLLPTED